MGVRGKPTEPVVIDRIVAAYAAGEKLEVIAMKHSVSTETIVRYARRAGLRRLNLKGKPGRPPMHKLTDADIAEIREWDRQRRALGSYKTVAAKYGVSTSLVERVLRDATYRPLPAVQS